MKLNNISNTLIVKILTQKILNQQVKNDQHLLLSWNSESPEVIWFKIQHQSICFSRKACNNINYLRMRQKLIFNFVPFFDWLTSKKRTFDCINVKIILNRVSLIRNVLCRTKINTTSVLLSVQYECYGNYYCRAEHRIHSCIWVAFESMEVEVLGLQCD